MEMYDTEISDRGLSQIIDRMIQVVNAWQKRSQESLYSCVCVDAMYFNLREDCKTVPETLCNILDKNTEGRKEIQDLLD